MIIAQISDTHICLDTPDAATRIEDFERTIADINALDPAPDVIIHTGDIVHNGRLDEYRRVGTILERAQAPVYLMVGNKDDRDNLRTAFPGHKYLNSHPQFVAYSIDHLPVRLIALDTLNPESNKGEFCDARIANLADLIEEDRSKPIAVFMHHPPFEVSVGPDPLNFDSPDAMARTSRALQESGSVTAVFSGHVHRPTWGEIGSIPATVMPCVATTLRKGDYPPDRNAQPIYYIHRFNPDGGFSTETRIVS